MYLNRLLLYSKMDFMILNCTEGCILHDLNEIKTKNSYSLPLRSIELSKDIEIYDYM